MTPSRSSRITCRRFQKRPTTPRATGASCDCLSGGTANIAGCTCTGGDDDDDDGSSGRLLKPQSGAMRKSMRGMVAKPMPTPMSDDASNTSEVCTVPFVDCASNAPGNETTSVVPAATAAMYVVRQPT